MNSNDLIDKTSSNSSCSTISNDAFDENPHPYHHEDSVDSGASFTYLQHPSTKNISGEFVKSPKLSYLSTLSPKPRQDSSSVSKLKLSTPEPSLYDGDLVIEMTEEEKKSLTKTNLTAIFSSIYGLLLTVVGGTIYINNQTRQTRYISELFSVCITLVGFVWLAFFHIDLFRYKRRIWKKMMGTSSQIDNISTSTDFNFAIGFMEDETPPYRFLMGKHSGSFYLKAGLAAFCFGHLINEGLLLGQLILDYVQEERYAKGCGEPVALITHIVKPLHSFYQLFVVFKYSNIVINRCKGVACFAVMHLLATCLCFWFGTIVEDALEDYHHKLGKIGVKTNNDTRFASDFAICSNKVNDSSCDCALNAILSVNNVQAIPYLFPFTIEFNLLLAGVWFIVWQNIGNEGHKANPHHFHHTIHNNGGIEEITYQSNVVISADCHASNKGLFAGLFLLLTSIISIIVFFVAMGMKQHHRSALHIHYFQEGGLIILSLASVIVAYKQLIKLDYNRHPITFLDDVLLFLPLPFFFMQAVLTVMSELHMNTSVIRIAISVLVPIQVVLQTPLIIDGLRRCSNSQALKYKKPGREVVTFLIVCNLTMWIINTFEAKSVESHYGLNAYYGEFLWMFVSHTTLPLMLFYRFHSSVCLADIWKSAYEKGDS